MYRNSNIVIILPVKICKKTADLQPKSQILLYKNSSPRNLDTITLAATNSTYYAVMVSFSSHLTVVIYCPVKKKKRKSIIVSYLLSRNNEKEIPSDDKD